METVSVLNHNKDILHQLNEYRHSNNFCDVTIIVQGREFAAHRAVLAAGGGFFAGLFGADMKERSEDRIELNELDSDVMDNILTYIYTGDIKMSSDNAQQIIMVADFLLLEKLKVAVDDYMVDVAKDISSDYFSTYHFAVQYKCPLLETAVMNLIHENFEDAWHNSQGFLDTSFNTLHDIVSSDDIVVRNEEIVFRAVLDWVNYQEERKQSFYQLFSNIRLCSLPEDFIHSSVISESLVTSSRDCLKLVLESMKTRCSPTTANVQHPRSCLDTYTDAVVVFPRHKKCNVARGPWCYLPSEKEWYQIPFTSNQCGCMSEYGYGMAVFTSNQLCGCMSEYGYGMAVYHEGVLLLINDNKSIVKNITVSKFDLKTSTWSKLTSFAYDIHEFSVVCFQGLIYFIGGEAKAYNTVTNVKILRNFTDGVKPLTDITSLQHPRKLVSAVCDKTNIYVLGGICHNPTRDGYIIFTQTVEKYDPQLDRWIELAPMKAAAQYDECVIAGGKIFRVPGMMFEDCTYTEVYDTSSNTWSEVPKPSSYIARGVLTLCDSNLYLIGGASVAPGTFSANKDISNTKALHTLMYDPEEEAWYEPSITPLKNNNNSEKLLNLSGTTVRLPKANIASFKPLSKVSAF